jgi:hypothetical protein
MSSEEGELVEELAVELDDSDWVERDEDDSEVEELLLFELVEELELEELDRSFVLLEEEEE